MTLGGGLTQCLEGTGLVLDWMMAAEEDPLRIYFHFRESFIFAPSGSEVVYHQWGVA